MQDFTAKCVGELVQREFEHRGGVGNCGAVILRTGERGCLDCRPFNARIALNGRILQKGCDGSRLPIRVNQAALFAIYLIAIHARTKASSSS